MEIQYCSDLHLEFPVNKRYVHDNPIKPAGEILLLAGDIIPFSLMNKEREFFDFVSDNFEHTYWVPGNHEYYHSDISERTGAFNEQIRSNMSLVNNCTIQYKHLSLIFSTMWSRISPYRASAIQKDMADFRLIRSNDQKLSVKDYNQLHENCLSFIANEFPRKPDNKTIVVTHHIPTFLNYPEKYRKSELNEAFAVELYDLIEPSQVDFWISGHSHEVVPDFKIGKTTLTSNQLGYVEHGESGKFIMDRSITL